VLLIDTARVLAQLARDMKTDTWRDLIERTAMRWSGQIEYGGRDRLRSYLVSWFENEKRGTFKNGDEEPSKPKKVLTEKEQDDLDRYNAFEGFK
jgi:hypothetical protein